MKNVIVKGETGQDGFTSFKVSATDATLTDVLHLLGKVSTMLTKQAEPAIGYFENTSEGLEDLGMEDPIPVGDESSDAPAGDRVAYPVVPGAYRVAKTGGNGKKFHLFKKNQQNLGYNSCCGVALGVTQDNMGEATTTYDMEWEEAHAEFMALPTKSQCGRCLLAAQAYEREKRI